MKKIRNNTITIILLILFIILISYVLKDFLDERFAQMITLSTAVFGVIAVIYQLNKDHKITNAEFIYNLNNTFSENEDIDYIYKKLKKIRDHLESHLTEDDGRLMGDYIMFFEIMDYLVTEKMIAIDMVDEIFANKFFLFINNLDVQNYQLKYTEINMPIIRLYTKWVNYRIKKYGSIDKAELYSKDSFSKYNDYFYWEDDVLKFNEEKRHIGY
ncbi:MAG: hypothetical protein ACLFRI_07820 [Candidatus Izemoplasmataceae bacterium]